MSLNIQDKGIREHINWKVTHENKVLELPRSNFKAMNSQEPKFSLNREVYEEELEELVSDIFTPLSIIHYCFTLPFQLPLKNGTRFYIVYNNHAIFFHFDKFSDGFKESMYEGHKGVNIAALRTRVEVMVLNKDIWNDRDDEYLYSYFVHVLEKLNNYTYAYRLICEDWKTKKVSAESLHCVIQASVYSLPDWIKVHDGPFTINRNSEQIITNLPPVHTRVLEEVGIYLNSQNNPLISSKKFFAESRYSLFNGDYQESVIYAQMCIESFLNCIYREIRLSKEADNNDIDTEFEETGLISRIKKVISQELGGDWHLNHGKGVVQTWYRKVYLLRNRIVHGGYYVAQYEAYKAFKYTYKFCEYLELRIEKNKSKLPDLSQYIEQLPKFFLEGDEQKKPSSLEID